MVSCPVAVSFACTITFFFGVPPVLELASRKQKGSKRQSGIISHIPYHIIWLTKQKALKEMGIGGVKIPDVFQVTKVGRIHNLLKITEKGGNGK